MMDELKKIFLAGIGSVAYTYEKASVVIDEMVEKGKLTMDEGKELTKELKRNLKDTGENFSEKVMPLSKNDIKALLVEMNLATKEDVEELKQRITVLEEKLSSNEAQ